MLPLLLSNVERFHRFRFPKPTCWKKERLKPYLYQVTNPSQQTQLLNFQVSHQAAFRKIKSVEKTEIVAKVGSGRDTSWSV